MKHIRLIIKSAIFFLSFFLFVSCGNDIKGTFYISDEARKYEIDTSIYSFKMIDNYGITEEFYMDKNIWYTTHHYFSEWGTDGDAFGETFGVAYNSILNNYFFMFVLRADVENTDLEIEWNQRDRFVYNLEKKIFTDGVVPEISFYDSLVVRDITYKNIIEIDYSKVKNKIDINTPVKTYISGEKGLIKLVRIDNNILERIE